MPSLCIRRAKWLNVAILSLCIFSVQVSQSAAFPPTVLCNLCYAEHFCIFLAISLCDVGRWLRLPELLLNLFVRSFEPGNVAQFRATLFGVHGDGAMACPARTSSALERLRTPQSFPLPHQWVALLLCVSLDQETFGLFISEKVLH